MSKIYHYIFLFIVFFVSSNVEAQDISLDSADRLQIKEYLKVLNNKKFEQKYYGVHIYEKYDEIKVMYAPDSSFKIFIFNGEFSSTDVKKVSKSYLHFLDEDKKTTKVAEADFKNVISIHKLTSSNYLLLELDETGSSYEKPCFIMLRAVWIAIDDENKSVNKKIIDPKESKEDNKLIFNSLECEDFEPHRISKVSYKENKKQLVFSCVTESANEPYRNIFYEWNGTSFDFLKEETTFFPID